MVHIVTYDLKSPNDTPEDYKRVIDAIKALFDRWCHLEKSVWIVSTAQSAAEVRDAVKPYLYPNDILFVSRLSGNWASFNLGENRTTWLRQKTF